jgi:hypothetical protein
MTMIRNILIITIIAALVPTAMSNVSTSADAEIALFSKASVDTDSLTISGNGDSAKMELKATNDNGKSNGVAGFQLTADNVLSTEVGDKVTVIDNVDFTKVVTTDARNSQKAIGITSNGVIDLAGYTQGVYTLDVVADDDRAYEAIIAIGDQTNQIVDKEITRINSEYRIEFVFPPIKDPKPPKDIGLPYCDLVSSAEYKAGCFDRQDCSEDTLLCSCRDGSKVEDWRDCKDAGEHPAEQLKRTMPKPEPKPIEGECFDGATPVNDECPLPPGHKPGDAYCMALGCPGSPPHYPPDPGLIGGEPMPIEPEPIECSEGEESVDGQCQLITTNPIEPIDPLLIDENSDDQSIIGDDNSDESEDDGQGEESGGDVIEGDEDSGSDDSEGSEESGGSDNEGSEESTDGEESDDSGETSE